MSTFRSFAVILAFFLVSILSASAQVSQIYIASEWQNALQQLNFVTGELTTLYTTTPNPDDLIINSAGQLIYSVPSPGTVNLWDPTTGINTVLANNIPAARDMEIEPGGLTMLIAQHNSPAQIDRYTFSTGTWTVFVPSSSFGQGGTVDGIAYDPYGNLYAVANHSTIIQIDPTSGAILATMSTEPHNGVNGGDGLTYDAFTNSLWATHDGKVLGGGLIQIPVQQTGFVSTTTFTFFPTPAVGAPDGIKSDGVGNLYIGAIHTACVYNIPTNTITYNVVTDGADGVAVIPGSVVIIPPPPPHPPIHIQKAPF